MGAAVKISDTEMQAIREAAAINSRSISGQAEHWIRIGRAVERNPDFSYARIEQALRGLMPASQLTEGEQEDYLDRLGDAMRAPATEEQRAQYAQLGAHPTAVGLDDQGKVVFGGQGD
jgi:hypothetical protein